MKTRSRRDNAADDDRDTESDESSLTNSSLKRKKITDKVNDHLQKYSRNGLQRIQNHLPHDIKRELENSRDLRPKSPAATISSHSNSNDVYVNGGENVDNKQCIRRSTRQRKFMYDNLNQTWLLASSIPEFSKLESLYSGDHRSPQEDQCVRQGRSEGNHSYELRKLGLSADGLEFEDMYSRVKRKTRKSVHSFYSRRLSQDGGSMADTEDTDQNGMSDSDTIDDQSDLERVGMAVGPPPEEDSVVHGSKYSLRPKKPITDRFQFPIEPVRTRRSNAANLFEASRHHPRPRETLKSSAHRSHIFRRKRHAIHNSSTSSSSDDERRFEKRKAISMARARNRCLPLNFVEDDLVKLRDRVKIGSSLADIDPMSIDKTVSFDSVGGLDKHIQSLKEMVLFPLMYPEVFERFKIAPPRGVLFYGPPGTGKTLVARALANECSTSDKRVAFFMRKGADCLSKWVGESERQLRLLFDQAYSMRPAIIFFDEIDGLAPVRSTRQDQIHSSIVSTLLALMDGLDNRGEIVIVGATNRLDAIDPALRRPGRFDRELLFPLPSLQAREQILGIIMKEWVPPQPESLMVDLAHRTAGYCGADLKALCSEAALVALRRRYPQIYRSKQKLQLDVETIQVTRMDFLCALKRMKPSIQRSALFSAKPLSPCMEPLLEPLLRAAVSKVSQIFPFFQQGGSGEDGEEMVHRPCFLLSGSEGQGQSSLAPALLYRLENLSVHRLDIPALYAGRAPEEACAQIFQEAQRNLPAVLFLPHIGQWWETLADTVRATFLSLLQDLEPSTPLLLLATTTTPHLPLPLQEIFGSSLFHMQNPGPDQRRLFFLDLFAHMYRLPATPKGAEELLPVAPPPVLRQPTVGEVSKLRHKEEATLRELRLFLRDILTKLARDRRFSIFARPVDPAEVPDYQEVIKNPMDLETMMTKIDLHRYETVAQFLSDIDLVCLNALEYNPDRDPSDRIIRHRACALKDTAHALVMTELDAEFEKICQDIQKARKERGESPTKFAPPRYHVLPKVSLEAPKEAELKEKPKESSSVQVSPTRFSKRIRGLGAPEATKSFSSPRRCVRYTIWRRRKSPWFGGRRSKLIRRSIPNVGAKKKMKLIPKFTRISEPQFPEETKPVLEERKEMSGTDSSATVISPKGVASPRDFTCFLSEPEASRSPSKRHLTCDNEMHCSNPRSPLKQSLMEEPAVEDKRVEVDDGMFRRLVERVVSGTSNCTVEQLLQLYSALQQCIFKHRKELNKGTLLSELEAMVDRFVRCKPS